MPLTLTQACSRFRCSIPKNYDSMGWMFPLNPRLVKMQYTSQYYGGVEVLAGWYVQLQTCHLTVATIEQQSPITRKFIRLCKCARHTCNVPAHQTCRLLSLCPGGRPAIHLLCMPAQRGMMISPGADEAHDGNYCLICLDVVVSIAAELTCNMMPDTLAATEQPAGCLGVHAPGVVACTRGGIHITATQQCCENVF